MESTKPTNNFWTLNESNQLSDEKSKEKFLEWHIFITEDSNWVAQNPVDAERCFSLLNTTQFTEDSKTLSEKAKQLKLCILEKYPHIFSNIKSDVETKTIEFAVDEKLKEKLSLNSYFNSRLNGEMKEAQRYKKEGKVSFCVPEGVDPEDYKNAFSAILNYLGAGVEMVTGDNVLLLYTLAHEYQLTELTNVCKKFLRENMDARGAVDLLNSNTQYPDLRWTSLQILLKDEEFRTKSLQEFLAGTDSSELVVTEDAMSILKLVKEIIENGVDKFFTETDYRSFKISWHKYNPIDFEMLGQIHKVFNINGLEIHHLPKFTPPSVCMESDYLNSSELGQILDLKPWEALVKLFPSLPELSGDQIESELERWVELKPWYQLIKLFPSIDYLNLRNCNIDALPLTWQASLKEVKFRVCDNFKDIQLPNASKVTIRECDGVTTVNAPLVEEVKFKECMNLKDLQIANASKVVIVECHVLGSISILSATEFECNYCSALNEIQLNNAIKIKIQSCNAISNIHAPVADTIMLDWCDGLKSIVAPKVKKIFYWSSKLPKDLQVPKTTVIEEVMPSKR